MGKRLQRKFKKSNNINNIKINNIKINETLEAICKAILELESNQKILANQLQLVCVVCKILEDKDIITDKEVKDELKKVQLRTGKSDLQQSQSESKDNNSNN